MMQSSLVADPVLERIARAIVDGVRPVRIILFGSRARGDPRPGSDYDLMVEVDSPLEYRECWREIDRAIDPHRGQVRVDIIVRKPGQFEAQHDDPGRMDWDIAREGVVIYPAAAPPLISRAATVLRVRESREPPPPSVRDWLARADEDLLAIEGMLTAVRTAWSAVCFHAQQAAEKLLKALLIRRWVHPPHTHDLAELVRAVRDTGDELPDLRAECELLKPYAVDARYPEAVPIPGEAEGRTALEAGRRIVAAARPLVSP